MKKAFLIVLGAMLILFVACETGLGRLTPPEGSYTEGGGTNRYSFMGGGNITYTVPVGADIATGDASEEDVNQQEPEE